MHDGPPPPDGAPEQAHGAGADSPIPCNVEAEQALLGAILVNNDVYEQVERLVEPQHFYDPVHERIYELIKNRRAKNLLVSPVTLKPFLEDDPGIAELGGTAYLAYLAGAAVSFSAAKDYGQAIYDMFLRREIMNLGQEIHHRAVTIHPDDDPREQIVKAEQALYGLAEKGRFEGGFKSFVKAAAESVDAANAAYMRDGNLAGISTGLIDLDKQMGGLHPSDLIILAGRPSMGKTTLATNIAFNIARDWREGEKPDGTYGTIDGGKVGFFSLEMSAEQLATRVLSEAARVPSHKLRRGDMTEDEFARFVEAARELERMPLYIDDTPALPISTVAARARRLKRQHGLDLLVIDYLQLLRPATAKDSRVNEVSEITQGLKAIAKELDIPVIALSQLSRQVESREDKRPQLSDLRESGSIEQDADVVMFVFREEYYREREKPSETEHEKMMSWQELMEQVRGKAEVILGKQRHGPIGSVELSFEGEFTKFGNLAKEDQRGIEYE
ncbi:replicative DNA helicase [Rhodovulum sp. DZ06]|uniref:replicative DNA helicase n=1 Tax=Rhodovulum sp. DZ06 TaxID=3425126 RepID=UPI003D3295AA